MISIASLVIPVAAAFWLPEWAGDSLGTLTWLAALIPAFLLSYYRGFAGVAVALAGGMAVITATQVGIVTFDIRDPDWPLLSAIVGVYLGISLGIGMLAEVLHRERRAAEAMAMLDQLTGLPNRRYADNVLEQEFAAAARGGDLAVVIYDLDRFKLVNDRQGHMEGDEVLRAFARVLRENTRRANVSARFGGEEFISILRNTGAADAVIAAQRMLDHTRDLKFAWGRQTVSAGIAAYEHGMGTYELLIGAADRALYQAKEQGRDKVCVAPSMALRAGNPPVPAAPPAGQRSLVYVVDDDESLLSAVTRMLHGNSIVVWGTTDPGEVIRRYAGAPPAERPALIITDVIMPTMTGIRMMEQIAQINPDQRVIYMSGYVHAEISWTGMPGSVVAILEKPFERERMLDVVGRALGDAAVEASDTVV